MSSAEGLLRLDNVVVENNVAAPMRDGTVLRANVYRPEDKGPRPVLLIRMPYGKDSAVLTEVLDPVQAARQGFIVVVQDTRGHFASEGESDSFRFEREDGYDSVEWAAKLPGSNGRVGMLGVSYLGNTQWMAAIGQPPSLAAIAPTVTWCDAMDGLFGRGGALELGLELSWTLLMGPDYVMRLTIPDSERASRIGAIVNDYEALPEEGFWELPVRRGAMIQGHELPGLGGFRVVDDPDRLDWCQVAGNHERVTVPSLHTGGWYDVFQQGTLDNFEEMTRLGRDARLVMGPWSHSEYGDKVGDLRFGLMSRRFGAPAHPYGDVTSYQLAWLRQYLDEGADIQLPTSKVRIFVMGRNEWRDENEWPPARAKVQQHFLRADGSLTLEEPSSDESATEFVYDPADPVPTVGGQLVMINAFPPGPKDQTLIEARQDVCVFTSAPLEKELEVTGRIRVVLNCVSSAPSTDWVARLCDVHPNGQSFNLCDGIVRVSDGADSPGVHEIDLWSTSNVFLPGHRIRVHITSSSFPRWDRNLNTGEQDGARYDVAQQRIQLDCDHPSYIELPVID